MSHHRETVTAAGAPAAAGPYSHAVKCGGLVFLSGQVPSTRTPASSSRATSATQTRRCLDNLAVVAAAAGASLADAVRCGIYVTDICTFKAGQRGLRRPTSRASRRRARRSASPRCRSARDVEIDAILALPD